MENTQELIISHEWGAEGATYIRNHLVEYNRQFVTEHLMEPAQDFCLLLKDNSGQIWGGLSGAFKLGRMNIGFFWIEESMRRFGFGKRLIREAEALAIEKNCAYIQVDTYSFQAPVFYEKMGFRIFGKIEKAVGDADHYFLIKRLDGNE